MIKLTMLFKNYGLTEGKAMLDTNTILNAFPGLVYAYKADSDKIIYMNNSAKELLGNSIGKTRTETLNGILTLRHDMRPYRIYTGGDVTVGIYSAVNGMTYAVYSSREDTGDGEIIVETAVDITDAEEERKEYRVRLNREHLIVSCIMELQDNKPFDDTIDKILQLTGNFLEAEHVYLFKYENEFMVKTHSWCGKNSSSPEIVQKIKMLDVFKNHTSTVINDVRELKKEYPEGYLFLQHMGIKNLIAAPIYVDSEFVGVIGADNLPNRNMDDGKSIFLTLSAFISTVIVRDRASNALRRLSYVDTLTGIYNRNKFIEDCDILAQDGETNFGVVYMDLNGLKEINDKNGHGEGDSAIKEIAAVIRSVFGKYDCYRIGGDEFAVICRNTDEETFNLLIDEFARQNDNSKHKIAVGYRYSQSAGDINEVVKAADENMYRDKKAFYRHTGQYGRYRVRNDSYIAISTPERIKNLMRDNRFVIWFQPRFSAVTNEMCGSEAFIRFFGEDGMIVSPMDFIPEMEENDTIHLLDLYVFRRVCEYLAGWIKKGRKALPVSINMSHSTLEKPNIIENIMEIWYDYNVPKELIVIEVSENHDRGGITDIAEILSELKKSGFRLAIDNFGSKYADLYLFAELKFDILKLDGDMVYKIETDKKTQLLSTSIMQICHNENIRIVAAGVENEQELTALREIGCDEVQGYYFDKPMSWDKFENKYL